MQNLNQRLAALSPEQRELLAKQMTQARKSSAPRLSLKPGRREGNRFPLSFVQERMWFMEQLVPGSPLYNMSGAVRITGPTKLDVLERCFAEIIRRHETLRTTFTLVDGKPMAVVAPSQEPGLHIIDFRRDSRIERERKVQQLSRQEIQLPFDLEKGPLFRLTLVRMAEEEVLFLMTMHHIISDGWSTRVFFQEAGTLYRAFLAGESSPLPELPFQYTDFAIWQQEYLQGEVLDSLLTYWKQKLGGHLPVLALPTDYPRPALQTFAGTRHALALSPKLTSSLRELSLQQGSTLFMTMLAAFHALLHRYTGQDDILVGIPIANRTLAGTELLFGAFINTLVIRADLAGHPSFLQLLKQVHNVALEAYAHQNLPFQKLVEELDFERDASRSPIFEVLFNFQNDPTEGMQIPGLALEDISAETAKFDLTLNLVANKERVTGFIEYNTDLFHPDTIRRFAGHYQTLLEGIVADPLQQLAQLPLLTQAEWQRIRAQWNATREDYPRDRCVHQLFEAQVAQTPDAIALLCEDQKWTYQEINRRANQLAHQLLRLGIGPETLVGIYLPRSPEMIIALLGILKSGGAYVPLDITSSRERLSGMIRDSSLALVLTQERLTSALDEAEEVPLLCLDQISDFSSSLSEENPGLAQSSESLAYVNYLSDSTQPQGVMVRHRNLVNLLSALDRCVRPVTGVDTLLAATDISRDRSLVELLWPLTRGARVVVLADNALLSSSGDSGYPLLAQALSHNPTLMQCTPSFMRKLTRQPEALEALKFLRELILGGEALPVALAAQLKNTLPARLIALYGSAETTTWSASYEVGEVGISLPIGSPLINTHFAVLDSSRQIMPVGVPGELYIGGDGVACGYLNHPDLSAERFIPDPFSDIPESKLYKTGERVRYLSNGEVEYGERPGDRSQTAGERSELERSEQTSEPSNELERTLIEIWKEVLGIDHVGIHESFFNLGGRSLLAIQVIFRLRSILHDNIPLSILFKAPTVAGMARSIALFREKGAGAAIASAEDSLDLAAEAVLDDAIQPGKAAPIRGASRTQQVLLTGATGFLGAFLLAELLQQPDVSSVHCLVRASTLEDGKERLRQKLEAYGLWNETLSSRIIPLVGDLARPLLGLAPEEFHRLAGTIEVIYHAGALLNFLYPYTMLKAVNVLGTQEILRLASTTTLKPVHYISSFHVFARSEYTNGQILREEENPRHGLAFTLGYTQSKWVAEQLVREAGARGLPVSIYRPTRISGQSQTGAFPLRDFVWQSIQTCMSLGTAPELDMYLDMVPVDYVSSAIVSLSRQAGSQGKNFHIVHPHPIHTSEMVDWVKKFGYQVKIVSFKEWCTLVQEHAERFPDSPARNITPFLSDEMALDQLPIVQLDAQNTRDGLSSTSIVCPPMDARLLTAYFSYSIQQGYFAAPALTESR